MVAECRSAHSAFGVAVRDITQSHSLLNCLALAVTPRSHRLFSGLQPTVCAQNNSATRAVNIGTHLEFQLRAPTVGVTRSLGCRAPRVRNCTMRAQYNCASPTSRVLMGDPRKVSTSSSKFTVRTQCFVSDVVASRRMRTKRHAGTTCTPAQRIGMGRRRLSRDGAGLVTINQVAPRRATAPTATAIV